MPPTVALWADNVVDPNQSGMGYHQRELLRALDALETEQRYEVLYTRRSLRQAPPDLPRRRTAVRALPLTRHAWYASWHALRRPRIDAFARDADVVHLLHASVTVPSGKPTIVWVVDLASLHMPDAYPRRRRLMKHTALQRAAADPNVTFVANTRFVMDDLCASYDVDPARVTPVHLGVDLERFRADVPEADLRRARERYSLPERFFLFVGMISPRKNVDVVVDGYARFRAAEPGAEHGLVLAGAPGWMHEEVLERARRTEGVQLAGYVAEEDLSALYVLADAFVLISSYEGFGLPYLEAMASGTPVIASNVTAMPEVVGDDGLLVDAIDAEAVGDAMLRLARDPTLAEELRRRGLARAATFTWERAARRCAELYDERASAAS